jgi:hypothetical protein
MNEIEKEILREAINERMQEVRGWIQQAVVAAQEESGLPIRMRDAYSGIRWISRTWWRTEDPGHIRTVPNEVIFDLLVDSTVGAAQHRLEKRQKAMERLG